MAALASSLAELARWSTVSIWSADDFLGSGFFLDDHVVVTCAHVVWQVPDRVTIRWREQDLPGDVVVREPAGWGEGRFYAHPDLAFIVLSGAPDHPVARLGPSVSTPQTLTAYGFSRSTPHQGVTEDTLKLEVAGRSGQFLRVKNDEIVEGLSGAPAVEESTGLVYGVVKASRDKLDNRGGWLVQATDVAVVRQNHAERLGRPGRPRTPDFRPAPGTGLHALLSAQVAASEAPPYRIVTGPVPRMSAVYVRQWTRPRAYGDRAPHGSERIETVIDRHRHVLLVGGPGTGKSALLQHIVHETSAWWLGDERAEAPFGPVFALRLPAAAMRGNRPWLRTIAQAARQELGPYLDRDLPDAVFEPESVPGVHWLLLVDGLDEVADAEERQFLISRLSQRVAEYGDRWRFLITSRPLMQADFDGLRHDIDRARDQGRLGEYQLRPFDDDDVRAFAERWFGVRTPRLAATNAEAFLTEVRRRRLQGLVRLPLLATIAAAVFENQPELRLPTGRSALYGRFVHNLVFTRERRAMAQAALLDAATTIGAPAREPIARFFDETERCLEDVATDVVEGDYDQALRYTMAWLALEPGVDPTQRVTASVREALLSTGLIMPIGNRLAFTHRGFAEYLAAGRVIRLGLRRRWWLKRVGRTGADNLVSFSLARWAERGSDASELLTPLLALRWRIHSMEPIRPRLVSPRLLAFCALLNDGLQLSPEAADAVVDRLHGTLRRTHVWQESATTALKYALSTLLSLSGDPGRVLALARDHRAHPYVRIAAAEVLADLGTAATVRAGVDVLSAIGADRTVPTDVRQWASYTLGALDGDEAGRAGIKALCVSVRSAATAHEVYRAVYLLDLLAAAEEADFALLERALSWVGTGGGLQQMALDVLSDRQQDRSQEDLAWPDEKRVRSVLYPAGMPLPDRLLAVARVLWRRDTARAEELLDPDLIEPEAGWARRVSFARNLAQLGLDDLAVQLLRRLATDPLVAPVSRVATLNLLHRQGVSWAAGMARTWAGTGPLELRLAALAVLPRLGEGAAGVRLAHRWLGEQTTPEAARIRIARVLARDLGSRKAGFDLLYADAVDRSRGRRHRFVALVSAIALDLDDVRIRFPSAPSPGGGSRGSRQGNRPPGPGSTGGTADLGIDDLLLRQARRVRLHLPPEAAGPPTADAAERLVDLIGATAAGRVRSALAGSHDLDVDAYRLARDRVAGRCRWWARLVAEARGGSPSERLACIVLAQALLPYATAQGRRMRREVWWTRLRSMGQPLLIASANVVHAGWLLVRMYVATAVGGLVGFQLAGLDPSDQVPRLVTTQLQLAVPVALVVGWLTILPWDPLRSPARGRGVSWLLGAVVGLMAFNSFTVRLPAPVDIPAWLLRDGDAVVAAFVEVSIPATLPLVALVALVGGSVIARRRLARGMEYVLGRSVRRLVFLAKLALAAAVVVWLTGEPPARVLARSLDVGVTIVELSRLFVDAV
jgi:hypothetical protein